MQIINGKWQDNNSNSINDFNVSELLEIGQKVTAIYGNDITYSRIGLISSLSSLSKKEEHSLDLLLKEKGVLDKLIGY
jgi:hypothetical protein